DGALSPALHRSVGRGRVREAERRAAAGARLRRPGRSDPAVRRSVSVNVIAVGAISALGRGREAFAVQAPGEPARVAIARDPALAAAGLQRPQLARAALDAAGLDRATELLAC